MFYRIIKTLHANNSNSRWLYTIQARVRILFFWKTWKTIENKEGPLSYYLEFDSYDEAEKKIISFCGDGKLIANGNIYEFTYYTYYV